ncbi:hypothetical protein C4J81_14300 [Deltaproteobacteria bacterium Smac51]|nr:hypothetical protein C4J81_14300 [Deltaproteobacteria bacterium Smac51]
MKSGFSKHTPELALLSVSFIWGTTFPLSKYVIESVPVFTYMAIRFFIASALLYPFARRRLALATAYDYKVSAMIGLALCGAFAFSNLGISYTTASKTAVVNGLYAVLTPFFYFLIYRAPIKRSAVIASVMAFVGMGMLGVDFSAGFDWDFGVTLVMISAVFTALQIVGVGRFAVLIDPLVLTFFQTFVSTVCCALIAVFTESWPETISFKIWAAIIFMAIFATVVAYFVQCRVQQYISHTVSAVIISTESVFGAVLAWLFLDETLTLIMLTGCVLLVAAMLIAQIDPGGDANRPTRQTGDNHE